MGETQNQPFQLSFNPSLKVDFQGSRVTSEGGLILVRELDERLGFSELIDRRAVASGGIAEAPGARQTDPEPRGDGRVSDKTRWEGLGQQFRDSRWGRRGPAPRPEPSQRGVLCWNPSKGDIVWGRWELKRKFRMIRAAAVAFAATLLAVGVSVGCGTSGQQKATPMEITSASVLPGGTVNMAYSVTLGVSGGVSPFNWFASGSLPSGLTLDSTGKISGAPTQTGSFTFFATVTDSSINRASQSIGLSLTVAQPIQITPATLPGTSPGVMYNATLSANGGTPPYTWSITNGGLPAGLTLNASTGAIAGISMTAGAFTFGIGVVDASSNLSPATTTLSIAVFPAPPRNAVLYTQVYLKLDGNTPPVGDVTRIAADGSLSSGGTPGFAPPDGVTVASPTLPLLFASYRNQNGGTDLHSLLINPDYTTTLVSRTNVEASFAFGALPVSVDPTGTNLYFGGYIIQPSPGNSGVPGISIYTANAYPQVVTSLTLPDLIDELVFTPDGTKAFATICPFLPIPYRGTRQTILELSRAPDGRLTPGPTFSSQQPGFCDFAISPDGKYLATNEVQVYQIESDGSLSPILPTPFIPTFGGPYLGQSICPSGITWDVTGSYLLVGADCFYTGGLAVMSFVGGSLTQTYFPSESFGFRLFPQPFGNFFYGVAFTNDQFSGMAGYQLESGAVLPLFPAPKGPPSLVFAAY